MSTHVHNIQHIKQEIDANVFQAARERVAHIFDVCERPVVSFSGGKDSTCVLNLCREEARKRSMPLEVAFFDEEILDPETIAYCERVRAWPDVVMRWFCVPIRHSLRSEMRTYWWPWDPDEREHWVRQPPVDAITELPGFAKGKMRFDDAFYAYLSQDPRSYAVIVGIRVRESLNRFRAFMQAGVYLSQRSERHYYAKPIYDWSDMDVWGAIRTYGWDYSPIYDKMQREGLSLRNQRLGPWGNVAGSSDTYRWASFYPDLWDKAIRRLPELKAQARYGRETLYKRGNAKPIGLTWQEWVWAIINSNENETERRKLEGVVRQTLRRWSITFSVPFPDEPLTVNGESRVGSWRDLARVVAKNDVIMRDTLL